MNIEEIQTCTSLSECARVLFANDNYVCREKVKTFLSDCGIDDWKMWLKSHKTKYCECCGKPLSNKRSTYCSSSCAAKVNNTKRKKQQKCLNCGQLLTNNHKFCTNKCQTDYENRQNVEKWLKGEHPGCDKNGEISKFVRNYIYDLHNHRCDCCGFDEVNPFTGKEILEVHHIDGDSFNNNPSNLQLLCPTHHAMTENYGRRNTKSTRHRYKK